MATTNARVQKHRDAMRAAGLRPIQLWVPDTRVPGFADECRRQTRLVAQADASDAGLQATLESATEGWADEWTE